MVTYWQQSITFYQLRTFLAVMKHCNYTHAARELHLSQPATSAQVHELEKLLGVMLFEQVGKRLVPTQAAFLLEEHARRVMAEIDAAANALAHLRAIDAGRLAIAASTTIGNYLLPKTLGAFHARYPRVEIALEIKNSREVCDDLSQGRNELGLIESRVDSLDESLELIPYQEDELVLIVPPWHPWAGLENIPLAALAEAPLLWRETGSGTRSVLEVALQKANIDLVPKTQFGSNEAIKQAVAANLGVAVISQAAVAAEVAAGWLATVPVAGASLRRTLHVIKRRHGHLSPIAEAFFTLLLNERERGRAPQAPPGDR
jgi:DNA-binding transcriptional LysR family regulator